MPKLENDLSKYYKDTWTPRRWQTELSCYSEGDLKQLIKQYKTLRPRGALLNSLKKYKEIIIEPWVGASYGKIASEDACKTVILLREYPLPVKVDNPNLLPQSRGDDALCSNIMKLEIGHLKDNGIANSSYRTLRSACRMAWQAEQEWLAGRAGQKRGKWRGSKAEEWPSPSWLDNVVVTDLVKTFAIFKGATLHGKPFGRGDALSRKSVHSKSMYRWALKQLRREIELLAPKLVVSFIGNTALRAAVGPGERTLDEILSYFVGDKEIAFFPHPGAYGAQRSSWGRPSWYPRRR